MQTPDSYYTPIHWLGVFCPDCGAEELVPFALESVGSDSSDSSDASVFCDACGWDGRLGEADAPF